MTLSRRSILTSACLSAVAAAAAASPALAQVRKLAAPARTAWARVNGVHLRYEFSGAGPRTVVLLHEMTASLESYDEIAPALAKTCQVLRYDLRDFGLSERMRGDFTLADEVEDLRALLAYLGVKGKVTLVGGAIGGAIALLYAATYPDQVNGVIAISPAAYMAAQPERLQGPPAGAPPAGAAASQGEDAAYPAVLQQRNPDRYARYLAIKSTSPGSMASTRAVYSLGFAEVLPKIQCPAIIVATTLWVRTPASFKELSDAIPKGRLLEMNTGHFATIASPDLLLPVITDFLKQV